MTVKEKIYKIVEDQPEDSSFDEILKELAFDRMIDRGLSDVKNNNFISDEEMGNKIEQW